MLDRLTGLASIGLLVVTAAVAPAVAAEPEIPGPSLGVAISGTSVPDALAAMDAAHPIEVRVAAEWSRVEIDPGVFDWSSVAPVLATLAARGTRVTLCVRGESPLHARVGDPGGVPDGAWLEAWTAILRSAVATLGRHVAVI
jgi:hypothetical protein